MFSAVEDAGAVGAVVVGAVVVGAVLVFVAGGTVVVPLVEPVVVPVDEPLVLSVDGLAGSVVSVVSGTASEAGIEVVATTSLDGAAVATNAACACVCSADWAAVVSEFPPPPQAARIMAAQALDNADL